MVLRSTQTIINWFGGRANFFMMVPIYSYFALQWGYDMYVGYEAYTFRLASHWDNYNMGYTFGKLTNSFTNFVSFYILMRVLQANPYQ